MGAVFAPADRAALKVAIGTCAYSSSASAYVCTGGCLGETANGSCPLFAATDATSGNPYGVIGDWDVSAVTSMDESKCTLPLCGHVATPSAVVYFEYSNNSSFIGTHFSHVLLF